MRILPQKRSIISRGTAKRQIKKGNYCKEEECWYKIDLKTFFKLSQKKLTTSKSSIKTLKKLGICSKLTIKTPEQFQLYRNQFIDMQCTTNDWFLYEGRYSDIFIVNSAHLLDFFVMFLLLTLSIHFFSGIVYKTIFL